MTKSCLTLVHLTASRFFGGPERQMLGLAKWLRGPRCGHDGATRSRQTTDHHRAENRGQANAPGPVARSGQDGHHDAAAEGGQTTFSGNDGSLETAFLCFAEEGLCREFLECARREGFEARALKHDFPRLLAAACELRCVLQELGARVIFCHGYKANLVGLAAARRVGIPAVAVSRGWTAQTRRVRLYEALDRRVLRWMDHVVCVSQAQAEKVRRAGVPRQKISVIPNAVQPERFAQPLPEYRQQLLSLFSKPPRLVVGAAGRLSPEKGFGVLVDAAAQVVRQQPGVGFVLFGDGALRGPLQRQIDDRGLNGNFVLAGFRPDFDQYLPHLDLLALPSFTEGLPNVVLEAFAAGVPVVATAVGGTPEVVEHGQNGYLAPPGDPGAMARHIAELVCQPERARQMGRHGRQRVARDFTFDRQAEQYRELFRTMGLQ
ncbi:MAG: glycosyltransferase family 4 protein [Thermoguttaceae bacterium]